jgi:predicted Fe-Mo cluster-binding NifX family protein
MILFISSQHPESQSPINERFGRCPWLMEYNSETGRWTEHQNPGAERSGGAGVAAAQFVIDHKADTVISGAFGPNASGAFRTGKITMKLFGSETSNVEQAAKLCLEDKLECFE